MSKGDDEWIELRWEDGLLRDWIEANRYVGRPRVRVDLVVGSFVQESLDYPSPDEVDVQCAVQELKRRYEEKYLRG